MLTIDICRVWQYIVRETRELGESYRAKTKTPLLRHIFSSLVLFPIFHPDCTVRFASVDYDSDLHTQDVTQYTAEQVYTEVLISP